MRKIVVDRDTPRLANDLEPALHALELREPRRSALDLRPRSTPTRSPRARCARCDRPAGGMVKSPRSSPGGWTRNVVPPRTRISCARHSAPADSPNVCTRLRACRRQRRGIRTVDAEQRQSALRHQVDQTA